MTDLAIIEVIWIAENKPDLFSSAIMWFLDRPYSHNAIIYKGKMWHATTPDGVKESAVEHEMRGCHLAARKKIILNISQDKFEGFLMGEKGKGYDYKANIGIVAPWLVKFISYIPILRKLISPPDKSRMCSEFVGNIINLFYDKLPGRKHSWTPALTERFLKPQRLV